MSVKTKSGPIEVAVRDTTGKEVGSVSLDPSRLGGIVRRNLLHQAVVAHEAARRVGTARSKTRGEIAFSNKKPWRQKGTGRARAGTRRSPLWRKGGTIFGPKPRDFTKGFPKKMRRRALQSALLSKFLDGEVRILSDWSFDAPRTREAVRVMIALGVPENCLVGLADRDPIAWKSVRNLPRVGCRPVGEFFAWEVLRYRNLLLTQKAFERMLDLHGEAGDAA